MEKWNAHLVAGTEASGSVGIKGGIFQGDSL